MDVNTIKSYLVSLGYEVDAIAYNKFAQAMKSAENVVERHTSLLSSSYTKASIAIASALGAVVSSTALMVDGLAKADLGYEKLALRMYMTKEAAKQYSLALKVMGQEPEDIRWIKELNVQYQVLMADAKKMELPEEYGKKMMGIREVKHEFNRLKLESIYGLQWIGDSIIKHLQDPLDKTKFSFTKLNDYIRDHIPEWGEKIGRVLADVFTMFSNVWNVMEKVGTKLKEFWDLLSPTQKALAGMAAIALLFSMAGPFGRAIMVIGIVIALISEFWDAMQGKETLVPREILWFIAGTIDAIARAMMVVIGLGSAFWNAVSGTKHHRDRAKLSVEIGQTDILVNEHLAEVNRLEQKSRTSGLDVKNKRDLDTHQAVVDQLVRKRNALTKEYNAATTSEEDKRRRVDESLAFARKTLTPGGGVAGFNGMLNDKFWMTNEEARGVGRGKTISKLQEMGFNLKDAVKLMSTDSMEEINKIIAGSGVGAGVTGDLNEALSIASKNTGIPPELIYGQWYGETSGFTNRGARELNNLAGIRLPGKEEYKTYSSLGDFATDWSGIINNLYPKAKGAKSAEEFAAALKRGVGGREYYQSGQSNYVKMIESGMRGYGKGGANISNSGNTNVNIYLSGDVNDSSVPKKIADKLVERKLINDTGNIKVMFMAPGIALGANR